MNVLPAVATATRSGGAIAAEEPMWTRVQGRRMFARRWDGPEDRIPLVLIHGMVVSSAYFVPTAELLSGDYRILAPDQPGFGRSAKPKEVLNVPELAASLIEWFSAANVDKAMVIANSAGCQVAAELAMRRPALVERLVLASPTMEPGIRTVPRVLKRWMQESRTQSPELKRLLVKQYARAGPFRAAGTLRKILADRIEDKLPFVPMPTLVVRGTEDPICGQDWAREVADLLPDGRLVTVAGAPHAMNFDAPDLFVRSIRPFLTTNGG